MAAKPLVVDPNLQQRRLMTLVRLLRAEAALKPTAHRVTDELTNKEMLEWAHQITNVMRPIARSIEELSDEELLS